ncbi:CBS domain-containing protein [Streptomyces sporangiiformans]|uniref:CBS domain-containing protein n=1 Tax=Streptomyces sporangiiformans TaxID=2315329 RepID=UPI001F08E673|nr:CBS domain-containing protein [Streptomyces sporangiiformans]
MTLVQTRQRRADPAPTTAVRAMDASGPRVCDDMTVEVALSVMASARVGYLLICDGDDQCTGSITRAQLVVARDSSAYTDQMRVRDVLSVVLPVAVEEYGHALGVLALSS